MTEDLQTAERYGEHVFDHSRDDQITRLRAITDTYDPVSMKILDRIGVDEHWRRLDVGAGTGTVSRWLAERAPQGSVTALDRSARFLQSDANLQVLEADINDESLHTGSFDLIHARFLLMHLPERQEILSRLVSWLAPGGWLVLSESIDLTTQTSQVPVYRKVFAAMWQALSETIGTDISWVRTYPQMFERHGLADIGVDVFLPSIEYSSSISTFWRLIFGQMRERILSTEGITSESFEQALALLDDPTFSEISPGMITAWARRAS